MIKFVILSILFSSYLWAGPVEKMVASKKYAELSRYYLKNTKKNFTRKQLIHISDALRKQRLFREDIKLNIQLMNRYYRKQHLRLLKDIKASNTIDPDDYPIGQKIIYWIIISDYANILTKYEKRSPALEKDYRFFQIFSKMLVDMEFRESKVDKINNQVNNHLEYLTNKVYRFTGSYNLQYVSWQREAILKGPLQDTTLNVTNRGYCLGGDMGMENHLFHFYVDGCFLFGSGGVKSTNTGVDYQQSNVGAFGFKAGPGASLIVSSSKSRIGVKIPFIYTIQRYQNPNSTQFSVEETSPFSFMTTLYSRFQFGKNYFQTEFGKYIQKEEIFWGLGFGREF